MFKLRGEVEDLTWDNMKDSSRVAHVWRLLLDLCIELSSDLRLALWRQLRCLGRRFSAIVVDEDSIAPLRKPAALPIPFGVGLLAFGRELLQSHGGTWVGG